MSKWWWNKEGELPFAEQSMNNAYTLEIHYLNSNIFGYSKSCLVGQIKSAKLFSLSMVHYSLNIAQ